MNQVQIVEIIPLQLPRREILARLGYHFHKTSLDERQRTILDRALVNGFARCEPRGAWVQVPVSGRDEAGLTLAGNLRLASASLAALLSASSDVFLMAATAGPGIIDAIAGAIRDEDGATALMYDAVGSETADAALDWIHRYLSRTVIPGRGRVTARRYSPGYGDLSLEHQRLIFDRLGLDRLGLSITDRFQLQPEKSVIGIAGLEGAH